MTDYGKYGEHPWSTEHVSQRLRIYADMPRDLERARLRNDIDCAAVEVRRLMDENAMRLKESAGLQADSDALSAQIKSLQSVVKGLQAATNEGGEK